jgi:hypothetical protein
MLTMENIFSTIFFNKDKIIRGSKKIDFLNNLITKNSFLLRGGIFSIYNRVRVSSICVCSFLKI